ncbi:MAG: heme NO-binding domain-containing protein [Planctomycetota bacterium]|nr:heme NO-binding domain-containing protein [Planctomycetota bacterium]
MMGHVLNLLTQFIEECGGPQAVEAAYARAGLQRREYRFETAYPEEEFSKLLLAAIETLGATSEQAEEGFARFFMRVSPEIFPAMFRQAGNARSLLERIPTLHRSIPAAASRSEFIDKLKIHASHPHELVYSYRSPHGLCRFLRRSCELVLEHYGEQGEVRELECAKHGAPACLVEIHFGPPRTP